MHEPLVNLASAPANAVFVGANATSRRISVTGHMWLMYTALVIAAAVEWLG